MSEPVLDQLTPVDATELNNLKTENEKLKTEHIRHQAVFNSMQCQLDSYRATLNETMQNLVITRGNAAGLQRQVNELTIQLNKMMGQATVS